MDDDTTKLEACINLARKLPAKEIEKNIDAISNLIYEEDDLLNSFVQKIDSRSIVSTDDVLGEFLKCEYNRDGDSYRYNLKINK